MKLKIGHTSKSRYNTAAELVQKYRSWHLKFAWFPTVVGVGDTRWLEYVAVRYPKACVMYTMDQVPYASKGRLVQHRSIEAHRQAVEEEAAVAEELKETNVEAKAANMYRRALQWLADGDVGDVGESSKAICYHMIGLNSSGAYPHDVSDFGRCARLLKQFPEWRSRLKEMAIYSPHWTLLAECWDTLTEMMEKEVGIDWSKGRHAPETYRAILNVHKEAERVAAMGEQP